MQQTVLHLIPKLASDIIPDADNTYNLGSSPKRWSSAYTPIMLQQEQ